MIRSERLPKAGGGFSIIELLVAGLLGLVLILAVSTLFIGTKRTYRLQEQLATLQSEGRFALMFLQHNIENAGWVSNDASLGDNVLAIDFDGNCGAQLCTVEGGAAGNDVIKVQAEVAPGTVDCNGLATAGSVWSARFYVDGNNALVCEGSGGGVPQPVIENVESFQVLYGLDTDSNGIVNQYVTAQEVVGTSQRSGTYDDVIAVQVALLVSTEEDVSDEVLNRTFEVLDRSHNVGDKFVRRQFRQTILLRNKVYQMISIAAREGSL